MVSKEYVGLLSLILTRGVAQKLVTELFPLGKISLKSINRFVDRHIVCHAVISHVMRAGVAAALLRGSRGVVV